MGCRYASAMTITEQLQFSVLTAPVAALDRRTLSQAWYSALYGGAAPANALKGAIPAAQEAQRPVVRAGTARHERPERTPSRLGGTARAAQRVQAVPGDRRAPRSALARKIERAILRPRSAAQKASFTIEGDQGRVHILLHTHGTQIKLVAICPPKARAYVAAALAQARYALASRGIELDAQTRGAASC